MREYSQEIHAAGKHLDLCNFQMIKKIYVEREHPMAVTMADIGKEFLDVFCPIILTFL